MPCLEFRRVLDRKSTRLNSSHTLISYAVFCLKKQNNDEIHRLAHDQPARHGERHGGVRRSLSEPRRDGYRHLALPPVPAHLGDVFFFNDTATTEIYTLSLHDALPI